MERALVAGRGSAAGCRGHRAGRPSSRLLRGIARGLKPRVAAGADGRRALELRELPEVFWDRLAEFLGACEEVGSWPEPLRVGVVALLPRPIVLLPLVYRIWAAARRPEVRAWVAGVGADGAEAPGRGADEAAWGLALEAECLGCEEGAEDDTLCGVFLDCSKCYERAPLQQLDAKASKALFPDRLMVLALGMYSGRRHVRVGPAVAQAVLGSCGLMAGCGHAVLAAWSGAAGAEAAGQRTAPQVRRYVDDWVVWVRASARAAAWGARRVYDRLVGQLEEAGMKLNLTKTGVVASSAAGLAAARAAFAGTGAPVVPSARDLGVDVCWGRRRQGTRRLRVGRARQQADRVSRLPTGPDFRSQVTAGLVVAGAAWGSAVDGLTASAARDLRRVVHRALMRSVGSRRAVEVDLAFHGPSHRLDPAEAAVTATLTSWVRWVPGWAGPADRLGAAWAAGRDRLRARWRGPLTATLAALRRLGWAASGPLEWFSAEGRAVPVDDQAALRATVHEDFRRREWAAVAARRADFRGAEHGIDEALTGEQCRRLQRKGRERHAGRLRCVLAGGTWPQARLAAAGMAESAECPRHRA